MTSGFLRSSCASALLVGMLLAAAPVAMASQPKPLAITGFTLQTTEEVPGVSGEHPPSTNRPYRFTQAGGRPYALTTTVKFASEEVADSEGRHHLVPTRDPKDIAVALPPGLLADPMAVPRCPLTQVLTFGKPCPDSTQLGVARLRLSGGTEEVFPIVNVIPETGQSAEFGLETTTRISFLLTAHLVRSENPVTGRLEYGFAVMSNNIPLAQLLEVETTFWGVPADPSHDPMRGAFCANGGRGGPVVGCIGGHSAGVAPVPFLLMPTDCAAGRESATIRADSWQEPGTVSGGKYVKYAERRLETPLPTIPSGPQEGFTGCDLLSFNPGTGIVVKPETELADRPVGLEVGVSVPLSESPKANATPLLRDTSVTLPEGMSVSPGVVDGIKACEVTGPEGINITGPESEEKGANGELQLAPGRCPDASTVGTAKVITPFLPVPVEGHVYLARPGCGGIGQAPCAEQDALDGNLYKLYLEVGGRGKLANEGIVFKVPFDVQANPATGQLTTDVRELVQAPYSRVQIDLFGGEQASLANPAACGPAVTTADFTPWSAPGTIEEPGGVNDGLFVAGTPDLLSSEYFNVQGCASPPSLDPGFTAGTVAPNAGKFSAFAMNLSRQDREQYVKAIQLHTPPGLLAMLSSVPLCPEAQANDPSKYGECAASKIGTTRVASGAGTHPFEIEGNVYLTGPHDGAPFGLSIVTHAVAGPFNLGLVVVRARIDIDPNDSTATITTDETGPYAVPQIIFGVPLRLKRITVNIDRPNFMFNPTNCAAHKIITAKVSGNQQAVASVSSPFAVGACKSLAFKPTFKVSASGRTSRANGASLDAKVSYPKGAMGNDANIARVKVSLPKQLPSRLTTLQKACPVATFNANPTGCSAASIVGIARTTTPLLPVQLQGPVYFVSHGGEEFPNLIVVLQGDGVRVDLVGSTFINKAGITSSTFKSVPDVPVNSFELYLPEGRFSALAANGNLCKLASKLKMPTEFVAQNGAVLKQHTQISVTGCPKARPKKKANRRARK